MKLFSRFFKTNTPPKEEVNSFDQTIQAIRVMELMPQKIAQLHLVLHIGSYLVDKTLLMNNKIDDNPLIWAAKKDPEVFNFLLHYYDYSIDGGMKAVAIGAKLGKMELLESMFPSPAINISSKHQEYILTWTTVNSSAEIVAFFISHLEHITPESCLSNCIIKSAEVSDPGMIPMLLDHPDLTCHSRLLYLAVEFENMEVFNRLIDQEVDLTYQNENGRTVFALACSNYNVEMARKLYQKINNPELLVEPFFLYMGLIREIRIDINNIQAAHGK